MDEFNQLLVPESFMALYSVGGRKPSASRQTITARYELCEDLAQAMVEQCQLMAHKTGLPNSEVLQRCKQGLLAAPAAVDPAEAAWAVRRTAELLEWAAPAA